MLKAIKEIEIIASVSKNLQRNLRERITDGGFFTYGHFYLISLQNCKCRTKIPSGIYNSKYTIYE